MARVESKNAGRWSDVEARAALDAWATSGESGAAFARRLGIPAQKLLWWRRRIGAEARGQRSISHVAVDAPAVGPRFVAVRVRSPERSEMAIPSVVVVSGKLRIEVHDVDLATAA